MAAESPEEIKKHIKAYTIVGINLLIFTGITVWIATVDLGSDHINYGVGILIATFKAALVALIFMHLNHERPLIYQVLLFTGIFAAGLMVLTIFHLFDPIIL